ncbi:hypothetical protein JOM56_011326 [Amanita muscaria]
MKSVQSERFCSSDADLVLQSSDGVQFKVHRKIMSRHSDVFMDVHVNNISDGVSGDVVELAESAKVLDLLLSLLYRLDHAKTNLRKAGFDVLTTVADAAEKYSFDMASDICEVYMCEYSAKHPIRVMEYAIKHNYVDAMDSAASWLIGEPEKDVLDTFEELKLLRAWMKYYSACTSNKCRADDALPKAVLQAIAIMRTGPVSFHNTDDLFSRPLITAAACPTCYERLVEWKEKIAAGTDSVRFSTFI